MKLKDMYRIIIVLIMGILVGLPASAKYLLYGFEGDVLLKQASGNVRPDKNMELNASDEIIIPEGAKVEIYNTATKEIFTSVSHGVKSVIGIMLDARRQSEKTTSAINDRMRFSAGDGQNVKSRLYTEGLVKRSMQVYDPEADNLTIRPETLALHVLKNIHNEDPGNAIVFSASLTYGRLGESGLEFKIENTLSFPIYVNIVKINETKPDSVEISELGQPMGCYVVLPGQSLARQHFDGLSTTDSHLLILTYCRFDIDELISTVNTMLPTETETEADNQLPVFITRL